MTICLSEDFASQVKESVDMVKAVELYLGATVGRGHFICCPFHAEKTASCYVDKTHYHCFGCNAHGDIISFVRDYFNLGFKDAIAKLNTDFALGIPLDRKPTLKQMMDAQQRRTQRKLEQAKKEREQKEKQIEYDRLYGEWMRLSWAYEFLKPTSIDNVDPRYIEACQKLTIAEARLKNAGCTTN